MTVPADLLVTAVSVLCGVIAAETGAVVYLYRRLQKREDQMIEMAISLATEGRKDEALIMEKIRRLLTSAENSTGNKKA